MKEDKLYKLIVGMLKNAGDYEVKSDRIALSYLYFLLSLRCHKNTEKVLLNSTLNGGTLKRDFFISTGIKRLRIPPNSYVEIKQTLISDTLYRELIIANDFKKKYPNSLCILVYRNSSISVELLKKTKKEKNLKIFQYDDFVKWISEKSALYDNFELSESEWKIERNRIVDNAHQSFQKNNVSFFLGAGVSQSAGGPSWKELLYKIYNYTHKNAKIKESDIQKMFESCGHSNIVMGRYVMSEEGEKENLSRYLRKYILYNNLKDSLLINTICKAVATNKLESIITYNYDDLVETAIEKTGMKVARVYCKSRNYRTELPVFHVHGLITQEEKHIDSTPILSELDYHNIYRETFNWSNVEQLHALDRNTCFFIGLSMTDPNLRRLLDFSRKGSDGDACHYAFLQREGLYNSIEKSDLNNLHFRKIEDQMHSFGISVIWFEDFDEIPQILGRIIKPFSLIG